MCMFVTIVMMLLDTETGEVECSNAGHNPPLFCTRGGDLKSINSPQGMGVGVLESSQCVSQKMVLKPGDLMFLYTDGVTEAMDAQERLFSEARLKMCLGSLRNRPLTEIVSGVTQEIAAHVQSEPRSDDITMLALRYNGPASISARRTKTPAKTHRNGRVS